MLFDVSAALPAIKGNGFLLNDYITVGLSIIYGFILTVNFTGYGYPYVTDSRNIGDDGEDEVLTSPTFDQNNWQASNNQPAGTLYTSYNKPTVAQQPGWGQPPQNLPYTPTAPEEERPVNGAPKDWGLATPGQLLPVNYQPSAPAVPQPGPVQPQSTSLGVASTNLMPASPSAGGSTSSPTAYYKPAPSSTSQAATSRSFDTWQPVPVSSGYALAGSSAAGSGSSKTPHLVYEDVFQYPSENTASSRIYGAISNTVGGYGPADYMRRGSSTGYAPTRLRYPTNAGARPVYLSGLGSASSGHTNYRPRDEISTQPQKPGVSTRKVAVSQRVSELIYPNYMFQARNGYQLGRYRFSQTRYTPAYPAPVPVSSTGVKGPAPAQPAAPKGVKNPQRYVQLETSLND